MCVKKNLRNSPRVAFRRRLRDNAGAMRERNREPLALGDVLKTALARSPLGELQHYELWTAWDRVVGGAIARHAQPTRLRRGVLVVAVDAPEWMHELHYLKQDLRDRLNAHLGRRIVRDVYLVLGGR